MEKLQKYVIIEYTNSFKIISETFKSMNRIKILDFDVSNKYIVFGASSGGIYVFKRFPCGMIKFIPSMEGSTLNVKISSDEMHLAIANSKGLVVILENFFLDLTIRPYVQNDHEGNTITAMNWYGTELYSGDNTGKVSVFTLAKAFFQNPSALLLNLNSRIVQIDNYKNYFLVSTHNRTYLCNGETGQYKQIGEKMRKSDNGACFCTNSWNDSLLPYTISREFFKTVEDSNEFTSLVNESNSKIYCARPKGRLWEANFETSVLKTFNFRNLPQENTDIFLMDNAKDSKLRVQKRQLQAPEYLNFNKIHTVCNNFILTYDTDQICIVDPQNTSLVFTRRNVTNLNGVCVYENFIFIWTNDFQMHVISVQNLEDLIIDTLLNKQYLLCGEICLHFKNYLIDLVETSTRLSLLINLKKKLSEDEVLLKKLEPIFISLENCYKNTTSLKTIEKGVMIIDNGYVKTEEGSTVASFINTFKEENGVKEETNENDKFSCIFKQYHLNIFQKHAEIIEYQNLIANTCFDNILILMEDFIGFMDETETTDVTVWVQTQLLKIASNKFSTLEITEPKTVTFLTDAFLKISSSDNTSCNCSFPLPKARKRKPEYFDIGICLFKLLNNKKYYLNRIPYFYGSYLKELNDLKNITNLRLLVQLCDIHLLRELEQELNYDTWEEVVKLFIQLNEGTCLNCSENIDIEGVWSWTELGLVMIRSIGPKNTIRILKRHSNGINNGEFTSLFFEGCIMAKAYEDFPPVMDVVEQYANNSDKLNCAMERYLRKQYLDKVNGKRKKIEINTLPNCTYCNLPLNGPILNQYRKCICGDSMHYLCFLNNDKICNKCITKPFT